MKNFIYILICILVLILNQGCRKFVELEAPETLVVTENTFANDETATAALLSIYASISDGDFSPYVVANFTGLCADELKTASSNYNGVYQNALSKTSGPTQVAWTLNYKWVYQANAVYEGCNQSKTLTPAVKKQLIGEALFIRAYCHFYLVNLWGDVPLVTSTDYSINATLSRSLSSEVYLQIIADLKEAYNNLNDNYVASNSVSTSTDRVRPNKATAAALLARVYLYSGRFAEAETQAGAIIGNKAAYNLVDLNQVFLKNSKEAIWQLQKALPSANNAVTQEAYNFVLTNVPVDGIRGSSSISMQLLNAFDSTDKRRSSWIGKFTNTRVSPNVDYYFPYKYKVDVSTNLSECSTPFRIGEQYLIRAEARAQQNNLAGAVSDVDVIRKRADIQLLTDVNPLIGKEELLKVILKERQRELFCEYGHRWFDLKRTGVINDIMVDVAPSKQSTWSGYKQLWPIPENETNLNTNLRQNDGY